MLESDVALSRGTQGRSIKVLFYLFFPGGGIGKYTHELLERMHAMPGVDCTVICSPDYEWRSVASYAISPVLRSLRHPQPLRRRLNFLFGQYVNPQRFLAVCRLQKPDVVHFSNINYLTFPNWGPPLSRLGVAVAATAHDVRRGKSILNRRCEESQLRAFYRFADHLFVHSASQQRELGSFAQVSPSNVTIVPHGPYTHGRAQRSKHEVRQRLGVPLHATVGLCFGQIRDEKNINLLLRAVANRPEPLYLIVAGRGGARGHKPIAFYRQLAAELGIADRIVFLERFIPDNEVADLYAASDWASLYYGEAFTSQSGVLSTCVHYRCPVVAADSGTLGETVKKYDIGVSAAPDDVASLSAAMSAMERRLASNREFEFDRYMTENSWEENARITVAAYREALKHQQP